MTFKVSFISIKRQKLLRKFYFHKTYVVHRDMTDYILTSYIKKITSVTSRYIRISRS